MCVLRGVGWRGARDPLIRKGWKEVERVGEPLPRKGQKELGSCSWEWPVKEQGERYVASQQCGKGSDRSLAAGELAVTAKFPQFSAGPALP